MLPLSVLHFFWITALLYEEQMSIGGIAVTHACCEPVLQRTTEQWWLHVALISAAMHFFWITALLYEEQMSIGVSALTQACCEPVLQSSTEQ